MLLVPWKTIPKANVVPEEDLVAIYKCCSQMQLLCEAEKGIGLSAVQVGIPWNLFVVKHASIYRYLVNCSYAGIGSKVLDGHTSMEGCLSLRTPNGELRRFQVPRFNKIRVTGKFLDYSEKLELKPIDAELDGLYADVYQHELDHSNGILISEFGKEVILFPT